MYKLNIVYSNKYSFTFGGIYPLVMKIKKEPIREDRYLNLKVDTYPMEFSPFDSIFYDFISLVTV